jgi:hypothetical protein
MSVDLIDLLAEFARVAIDGFLFAVYAAACWGMVAPWPWEPEPVEPAPQYPELPPDW